MQDAFSVPDDLYHCLWKWVQEFADESNVLLSTLASCLPNATTNVINNVADFAEFWYPLYIDFLLDLPIIDPYSERCRFIEQCRIHFARNPGALKLIDDFEANYTPDKALFYYSCEGFIYRLVNRALRQQAIGGIMSFRFLLHDIRDQLRLEYKMFIIATEEDDFPMTFFRGQRMSLDELNKLQKKHRAGTLITTNSYFSTTMNRDIARKFAGQSTEGMVSVLFEVATQIKNSDTNQRKPFAFIGSHSKFGADELEVLFSIGSFFKINKIFYDESDAVWIVQVIFIDDDDTSLEITKDYRTLRACSLEAMIVKVGNLLADHPQQGIPVATAFYNMITALKFSEILTAACYTGLGWLALKEENLTSAIELQRTALKNYEGLTESEDGNLTHLRIMCYNCIGTAYRLMKEYHEALKYFLEAQKLIYKIPIDKYAMYNGYRNITAVNIASIYKLMNDVDRAWDTYKKMLAHEMNSCVSFHGHTYLTIAQAGLREAQIAHNTDEYERCSLSWKAFLDVSLTSMSSNYRRSIVSGVLLLGFEYANNEQTRTMAIDYFKKIITTSQKYVNVTRDDRLIVLQCHNQVSRLYTKKRDYDHALNHALEALQMCNGDDLTDITECYESMAQIYEQRLLDRKDDLTPEDINRIIISNNPFASLFNSTEITACTLITFNYSEFAFGQFLINKINPALLQDTDRKRQLVYCLLKIAALTQMQGYKEEEQAKIGDDDLLRKRAQEHAVRARQLIHKSSELLKDNPSVQRICANNLAYIECNFEPIIEYYSQNLKLAQQKENTSCIGEDAFCYIAHLYGRKTNVNEEHQWYKCAVEYFQDNGHICEHTVVCFYKLAHFYEKHNNFVSAIDIYQSLICYLLKYKPPFFLRTSIEPIVMNLVQYFKEKDETERAIAILQQLVQLILTEPADDKYKIDEQFKKIIAKCNDEVVLVIQAYSAYLEVMLRHKSVLSDSYIRAVEPAFYEAISVYQTHGNYRKAIEACQQFVKLLVSAKTDRSTTGAAFKRLALDFESLSLFEIALKMYTYLGKFIIEYQNIEDLVLAGLVISRCKFLKQKDAVISDDTHQMLVHLMIFYHNNADPQFVLYDYLKTMKKNYERHSATGIYMSLLEFCLKHRSENYNRYMTINVAALKNRPKELIAFVTTNRINYKELILAFFEQYGNKITVTHTSNQSVPDFKTNAEEWLWSEQDAGDVYWSQLLCYLLEWQSKDDECLASCYMKMDDMNEAASIFDTELYGDPALKFSPNACRRYLHYVYPQTLSDQRINLERRYHDHFLIEYNDSFSDRVSYEVLPIE
jgi:tetratricopeptide (TPR) repeat protein